MAHLDDWTYIQGSSFPIPDLAGTLVATNNKALDSTSPGLVATPTLSEAVVGPSLRATHRCQSQFSLGHSSQPLTSYL